AYKQELKEKFYSALKSMAKINNLTEEVIEITNKQEKQKLPDWVHSNLKSHIYRLGLENKAWKIDKTLPILKMELDKTNNITEIYLSQEEPEICLLCNKPDIDLEDNNTLTLLKEEKYIVEKLFKYLSKELQNFSSTSKSINIENSITSEIIFVKIHDKIVQAKNS
ncbi:17433_t:CDS:2, partial [Gigaspora margarita]